MASIKNFADFNLDDILISEDYKAVDSADEEDLEKTVPDADADADADASAADPDYENDFEEQSEYAGSPQASLKYDAQKMNSLNDSGDNDTYEDDYHDVSTTIQDGEEDVAAAAALRPAASTTVQGPTVAQVVSSSPPMLGIASPDAHIASAEEQKQTAPPPRPAAAAIQLVTTVHRDSSRALSSDYFLNTSADLDSASAGERPDTVVNMKSMPSKLRPNYNYDSNFSPPPLSPPAQRYSSRPPSASPPPSERSSVQFVPQPDLSRARSSASSSSSADRSMDATSNALRAISAQSTSIARRKEAPRGPMGAKVSRVQVVQMDSGLQGMLELDAAKKERAKRAGVKAAGCSGASTKGWTDPDPIPAPPIRPASADYTAENLLRSAVRKDGRARVKAVPTGQGGQAVLTADLLALVSEMVDARVARRMEETECKRQFFGEVSRQAVRVPSSSGPAAPPDLAHASEPFSATDPEIRHVLEYERERRQLSRGGDMAYRSSYEFTTVTSPRASVDREAPPVLSPAPHADPPVATVAASQAPASTTFVGSIPAPALSVLTASPEALERFGGPAEAIYTGFLADVISTCKERAAQCRSTEEMVMHRCLAQRLFAHFGSGDEVLRYKDAMAAAAQECALKVEGRR